MVFGGVFAGHQIGAASAAFIGLRVFRGRAGPEIGG